MDVKTDREAISASDQLLPRPVDDEGEAFEESPTGPKLTQLTHPASRGKLRRVSRDPAKMEVWMWEKPSLKERNMGFKGDLNKVREQDPGLQLALNGDREALGRLFAFYMPQPYRVAYRILGTPQDAEDALQDGLLGAMRHLGKFECRSHFSTWLTRIVINTALMQLRKSRREALTSIDQKVDRDEVALADRIIEPGPNPEEIYLRQEQFQQLRRALQIMPEVNRRAWRLRHGQGLKIREVAEIMGIPMGTLKGQFCRARRRLRKKAAETGQIQEALHSTPTWRS